MRLFDMTVGKDFERHILNYRTPVSPATVHPIRRTFFGLFTFSSHLLEKKLVSLYGIAAIDGNWQRFHLETLELVNQQMHLRFRESTPRKQTFLSMKVD